MTATTLTLIQNRQVTYHQDTWAVRMLFRELVWGPEDFQAWVRQRPTFEYWDEEVEGGVVVDFDRRELVWAVDAADYWVPRVDAVHQQLLQTAWPGFSIRHLPCDLNLLAEAAGADDHVEFIPDDRRPATIHEASGVEPLSDVEVHFDVQGDADDLGPRDSPPEDSETESGSEFSDSDARAWITLIEKDGTVRHRQLERIPRDLLRVDPRAIQRLRDIPPAEIPPERRVIEGMWIDLAERTIGLWGGQWGQIPLSERMEQQQRHWPSPRAWGYQWCDQGYARQCELSGAAGSPLSDTQALGILLPMILSTKRLDGNAVVRKLGEAIRGLARVATGCLSAVICLPLLIFGLIFGHWNAIGLGILLINGTIGLTYAVIEYRYRRQYRREVDPELLAPSPGAATAGPLNPRDRRQQLDRLLSATGFPSIAEIEPHFAPDEDTDMLLLE